MGAVARWSALVRKLRSLEPAEVSAASYAWYVFRKAPRSRAIALVVAEAERMRAAGLTGEAKALYRRAADAGDHHSLVQLVNWPGIRDDPVQVEALYRAALEAGDLQSLADLALHRARQGDTTEARALFRQAIEAGSVTALTAYAVFLNNDGEAGEFDQAIAQCRQRVAAGETGALALLGALLMTAPGGETEAEAVLRQGAALLENRSRSLLAALLLDRGAVTEATELVRRLLATGDEHVLPYAAHLAREYELPVEPPAWT